MSSMYAGLIGSTIGGIAGGYFGGPAGAELGAQIGGSIGDVSANKAQQKYDINQQVQAEYRNYLYTKKLMDYQNAYNSPSNQMKRLQDAGLNPMLVYGGGNVVGNQSGSGSAPSTQAVPLRRAREMDIMRYQALENQGLSNQLMQEQLLAQRQRNDAFDVNQQAQLANVIENNNILKARSRYEQAMADIAEHDRNVITPGRHTTSKDGSYIALFDRNYSKELSSARERSKNFNRRLDRVTKNDNISNMAGSLLSLVPGRGLLLGGD